MEFPKLNGGSAGSVFEGIKEKLGFGDEPVHDGYYGAENDGAFDDYSDDYAGAQDGMYAGDAYDGSYPDSYSEEYPDSYASHDNYASGASNYSGYTGAGASEGYAGRDSYSDNSYGNSAYSDSRQGGASRVSDTVRDSSRKVRAPKLISLDDVRARTQVPERLSRNPLPERKVTKPSSVVANWGSRLAGPGGTSNEEQRSVGLKSLFNSTTGSAAEEAQVARETFAPGDAAGNAGLGAGHGEPVYADGAYGAPATSGTSPYVEPYGAAPTHVDASDAYDPYDAYENDGLGFANGTNQSFVPKRQLSVVAPMSYAEVEAIPRALKAGDVVVLVLTRTPDALSKRVLDFSFGAASALDASVDTLSNKVFSIARDHGLTPSERTELRNLGVL